MVTPRAFAHTLVKVSKPGLLRNGLPYHLHGLVDRRFEFKSINYANAQGVTTTLTAAKQLKLFKQIQSEVICKPYVVGIGSYPVDMGCNAVAASLLYKIHDINKGFEIFTVSALLGLPQNLVAREEAPEVLCIMDLAEDSTTFSIENVRAIAGVFKNSFLVIPVVTKNIAEFFRVRLHKVGIFFQLGGAKKIEEV